MIYIDTERKFSAERLVEMANARVTDMAAAAAAAAAGADGLAGAAAAAGGGSGLLSSERKRELLSRIIILTPANLFQLQRALEVSSRLQQVISVLQ